MIKPDHSAVLLVVDVQNSFLPGGSLAVNHGDQVVPVINRIAEGFAHVVMTQDWHPAGHSSFASAHAGPIAQTTQTRQTAKRIRPEALAFAAQNLFPPRRRSGRRFRQIPI